MTGIDRIDYSAWTNSAAKEIAQKVDKDGVKGLQGQEIFEFARAAKAGNIEKEELAELLGVSISSRTKASARAASAPRSNNPDFDKAVEYYNTQMNSSQRYQVTNDTYNNLSTRLYKMEKAINEAFQECAAYNDIMIVPRWHYRFYPYIDTRLVNFDLNELREVTTRDMESLHELRDKLEYIIEEANGETEHTTPEKKKYDVDEIAQRRLGMSYEEFASKYASQLEAFKYTTLADVAAMSSEDRAVYARAKAYAAEMLETTINEAHTTNWDIGERKLDETMKSTGDMYIISDFEYDGITEDGLAKIQSGVMFKAFEEALISKHQELDPTGIEEAKTEEKPQKPIKRVVNGAVLIFNPDGTVFDMQGRQIK